VVRLAWSTNVNYNFINFIENFAGAKYRPQHNRYNDCLS
jgi:hypothetical protein